MGAFRIADKAVAAAPVTDAAGANVYELGAIYPAGRVHVTLQEVSVTVARSTIGLIGVGGRRVTVIVFEGAENPPCATPLAVIDTFVTVCDAPLTVYVPPPPVPVPIAVMVVPALTPVPEIVCPTARKPPAIAVAVSVVTAMVPVNVTVLVSSAFIKREYVCPAFRPVIVPVRFVEPVIDEVVSVPVTDVPVAGVAVY